MGMGLGSAVGSYDRADAGAGAWIVDTCTWGCLNHFGEQIDARR